MAEPLPTELTEIETTEALRRHLDATGSIRGIVVQGLDLTLDGLADRLCGLPAQGAYFLGCRFPKEVERHIRETGGTIFPAFDGLPFHPYRSSLYEPHELMHGYERGRYESFKETRDYQIYTHCTRYRRHDAPTPILAALAYRLHDHAIDDALYGLLHPAGQSSRRVVGIMGGHRVRRDEPTYVEVARMAWMLARRGYFVATGGGPGAMEAANLGAYLANETEGAVEAAVHMLAPAPTYDHTAYFDRAYAVLDRYPDGAGSLAVPTWFYGHEPSNLFARHIAKYFANSIREDGLLAIAKHGVIFAPGSAGTIQEVFMDAAQNHYTTFGAESPMVFYNRTYWTERKPVYPLLKSLAGSYGELITTNDDPAAVVAFIEEHPPRYANT